MDKEQVEVISLQLFKRSLERPHRVVVAVHRVVELGGDKNIFPVHTAAPDSLAHSLLVAVALRRVDVAVARLKRRDDRIHACFITRRLPSAEADNGYLNVV